MAELILIVDDEADIVSTLEYNLERGGFRTRTALSGRAALEQAALEPRPDLIVLDLMLPDISGTEVCRRLRLGERTREIPVLMLTAKTEEIDRVVGFEVGADDYVTKPFSVRELVLRVRAILRRGHQVPGSGVAEGDARFGSLRIDATGHRAWVADEAVYLTALEFKLLTTFLARKGRVQTRETLLEDVWGIGGDVTTRTVDTHVKRLREKLGEAGAYLETVRGVGYRFKTRPDEGPSD